MDELREFLRHQKYVLILLNIWFVAGCHSRRNPSQPNQMLSSRVDVPLADPTIARNFDADGSGVEFELPKMLLDPSAGITRVTFYDFGESGREFHNTEKLKKLLPMLRKLGPVQKRSHTMCTTDIKEIRLTNYYTFVVWTVANDEKSLPLRDIVELLKVLPYDAGTRGPSLTSGN